MLNLTKFAPKKTWGKRALNLMVVIGYRILEHGKPKLHGIWKLKITIS